MKKEIKTTGVNDSHALAGQLTGRYGRLALTRAAGAAAAAEREGNREQHNLWQSVIVNLRQEMGAQLEG